jgi:Domain of unknown function (DUF4265)
MADHIAMTVQCGDDEPLVEFPAEDVTASVPLTPVGDRLYRIDGVPVLVESAAFGDIIEAEPIGDGRLRFVRVAQPGGWRTFDYLLAADRIDSDWGQSLLRELEARGGHWERVCGGMLFICIPPDLDLDPTPWVELACSGSGE